MKHRKFELAFLTTNAAFDDGADGRLETMRLLEHARSQLREGNMRGNLRDLNGNIVGNWSFEEDLNASEGD